MTAGDRASIEPMSDGSEFEGDLDGYLAWAVENFQPGPMFCAKHWAPCPVEGKAGLVASVLMTQAFIAYLVPEDVGRMPEPQRSQQLNSLLQNTTEPACCKLGDEYMAALWAEVDNPRSRPPFPPAYEGRDLYAEQRANHPRE